MKTLLDENMDTLIAATARENSLKLITTNRRDFEKVPGLDTLFVDFTEQK